VRAGSAIDCITSIVDVSGGLAVLPAFNFEYVFEIVELLFKKLIFCLEPCIFDFQTISEAFRNVQLVLQFVLLSLFLSSVLSSCLLVFYHC